MVGQESESAGTFEQHLMGCLRIRDKPLVQGFLHSEGLSEADMFVWGSGLELKLMAFERQFRGCQHLLRVENCQKGVFSLSQRRELKGASASICETLLEKRSVLKALDRFKGLYGQACEDAWGAIDSGCASFIAGKLERLIKKEAAKIGSGCTASGALSASGDRMTIRLGRGRAKREHVKELQTGAKGKTLSDRFEAAVKTWREIEKFAQATIETAASWPSEKERIGMEEVRAMQLIDGWMRGLSSGDRETLRQYGAKGVERWFGSA